MKEGQEPLGSAPINQLMDNAQESAASVENNNEESDATNGESNAVPVNPHEDRIATLEKMLKDSQSMIGRQSESVGTLRKELDSYKSAKPAAPAAPTFESQIDDITAKMESGDLGLKDGNRMIAKISAEMGASNAMTQISQQQQQEKIAGIQNNFLKSNPDFVELRDSGALQPYLDADPMADHYTAYKELKADQNIADMEAKHQAAIAAAEEKGAKLAQGAAEAGKVLGKSGTTARSAVEAPKTFKTSQEAHDAMLKTLQNMRSASA